MSFTTKILNLGQIETTIDFETFYYSRILIVLSKRPCIEEAVHVSFKIFYDSLIKNLTFGWRLGKQWQSDG